MGGLIDLLIKQVNQQISGQVSWQCKLVKSCFVRNSR